MEGSEKCLLSVPFLRTYNYGMILMLGCSHSGLHTVGPGAGPPRKSPLDGEVLQDSQVGDRIGQAVPEAGSDLHRLEGAEFLVGDDRERDLRGTGPQVHYLQIVCERQGQLIDRRPVVIVL